MEGTISKINFHSHFLSPDDSDEDNCRALDTGTETTSQSEDILKKSSEVSTVLEDIDNWSFNAFHLTDVTEKRPLSVLGRALFDLYGILKVFEIPHATVETFLDRLEDGYGSNEYHNSTHASAVAQTMHYFLTKSGIKSILTNLEVFASLFAALIHDYGHAGKTNRFLIMTGERKALLYNDRSVQENHHLSASFFLLKEAGCNILENLSRDQYRTFRTMVIDMVLSTDMAFHFQMMKDMKTRMGDYSPITEKTKVMSFVLHTSDIASSCQGWNVHIKWVRRLFREFFKQGDLEKELGLPVSPMCDRETTLVPETQLHWMDIIVEPTITMCSNIIERLLNENAKADCVLEGAVKSIEKPWVECLRENKRIWKSNACEKYERS